MIHFKKNTIYHANCVSSLSIEVKNFNILTSKMDDDFLPYRINKNCMMWVSEEGFLGEIECIYPNETFKLPEYIYAYIPLCQGLPLVEGIYSDSSTAVYLADDRYILIFEESGAATIKYQQNNVIIYASNQSILAIECKAFQKEL